MLTALAAVLLFAATRAFTTFLDFVTSANYIVEPLWALLNYLLATRCEMPEDARPNAAMRALSLTGIAVMGALATFLMLRFG